MKLSEVIRIVHPEYVYLRLKPNNSIRNNNSHKLARTIAAMYKNVLENIKREEVTIRKVFGRTVTIPTKVSYSVGCKVSFLISIEKKRVEFFFIIPKHHLSVIREKMSDIWSNITIEEVTKLPELGKDAAQYQLVYAKEDGLSVATDRRGNELLHSTLNVLEVMEEGDRAGVLYNFIPSSQFSWRSSYKTTIEKVKNNVPVDRNKLNAVYLLKLSVALLSEFAGLLSEAITDKKARNKAGLLEVALERMNGGRKITDSTSRKASATIMNTQIVVMSSSVDPVRQRNNARSLAQSFDTISEDNALQARPYRRRFSFTDYSIRGAGVNKMGDEELQNFIALPGRDVLEKCNCIEKVETHETEVPEDLRSGTMRIGTNRYRGHDQMAYLSTDKEYQNLTLVLIGPTRAGKTTLIGNLSYDAIKAGECVVVFDYIRNCELSSEVSALFPKDKTLIIECGDPHKIQGLGYNEVGFSADPFQQYDNAKKQTTQLLALVNSINTDDTRLSAKMERYLTSASLVVFIQGGSIRDVFTVLTDHKQRAQFLSRVPKVQTENLNEYIASLQELDDYKEVRFREGKATRTILELVGTKEHLITGVIDRLNKLKANTYMEMMLKKSTKGNIDLVKELQKNHLICIKMPESMFATDGERDVYTTYWMTKLWLALQVRSQQIPDRNKLTKVNLVIDELYQVKNTEGFLTEKLSRLAKFAIKPIISCHYLNQISIIRNELRSANASYMLISGCDKNNYKELKDELQPFDVEDLLRLPRFHSMNLIKSKEGYSRFITKLPQEVSKLANTPSDGES